VWSQLTACAVEGRASAKLKIYQQRKSQQIYEGKKEELLRE
jgi:hypothetical protein